MDPNDTNTTPDDTAGLDAAIDSTDTASESLDDALGESLDRAVAEPDPVDDQPADEQSALEPKPADEPVETPPADEPVPGSPEAAAAEAAKAAETQPEAPQPDAEVEAEITSLGLKEKSAARFRELTAEVKELAPIREQLHAAGIKDLAELPRVIQRSRDADELISMVQETGATPDQYGMTLDYLKVVNAANGGDLKAAEEALTMVMSEAAALAKALGREIPGVHDPLAEHADLQAAVESGDMDRKAAAQVAHARFIQQSAQEQRQQQDTSRQNQQQAENARDQLIAYDRQMQADPQYVAKRPMLDALVSQIRSTLPPSQWLAATQQAYASIPSVPAPVAPPPQPAPVPHAVRPSGPRAQLEPATFDSLEDALDFGIAGGR